VPGRVCSSCPTSGPVIVNRVRYYQQNSCRRSDRIVTKGNREINPFFLLDGGKFTQINMLALQVSVFSKLFFNYHHKHLMPSEMVCLNTVWSGVSYYCLEWCVYVLPIYLLNFNYVRQLIRLPRKPR
jgi:hypothetical protein